MIKQATLPFALRLTRSVVLSSTAAVALGGIAGLAHAAPQASSVIVTNGSLVITEDDAGHTVELALSATDPNVVRVTTDATDSQDFDRAQFTQIVVTGGRGDDTVRIGNGFADELVTVDGGRGNDTIVGGDGNDLLIGGNGNDAITGGKGKDVALLGGGSDLFIWNPGDGSDTVDGQRGSDTMLFNGSDAGEHMIVSADGSQSVLTRDVGGITMNMGSIEGLDLNTLGGSDLVEVGDLTGTRLAHVDLGLAGSSGASDGVADEVVVSGTEGNDNIRVRVDDDAATVRGLHPVVNISGADASLDRLQINALGGRDKASVKDDVSTVIQVSIDLGDQQRSNHEPNDAGERTHTHQSTN